MTMRGWLKRAAPLVLAIVVACEPGTTDPGGTPVVPDTTPPQFQREMRGLWIATVANIDWPSATTLTADQQKAELVDILTRAAALGTNAIVLQIRPAGDAVYQSSIEPWAALLSGTQGTDPGYDPLAFAIEEAHKRGLQLHAWINPFRGGNTVDSAKFAPTHSFRTRRAIMRIYGTQVWFDPGEPEAVDHTLRVLADIVTRYDIDGIHADDFFYPYPQTNTSGQTIAFPDDATYTKYGAGAVRDDWRRANIDRFVERMYNEMHAIKPQIQVGISPFGIWRPGNPAGVNGLDAYAAIYADSRKWLQQGWVDYLAPQLYWAISAPQQSFPSLLDWWVTQSQNSKGRHVWPGLASYRVQDGTSSAYTLQEIPSQIERTRSRLSTSPGHLLYNTTWTLKRNSGAVAASLTGDIYMKPALVPVYTWLDATPPPAPTISVGSGAVGLTPAAGETPRWWSVRAYAAGKWTTRLLFGGNRATVIEPGTERVLVQVYDQAGNASAVVEWRKP